LVIIIIIAVCGLFARILLSSDEIYVCMYVYVCMCVCVCVCVSDFDKKQKKNKEG